ncbi:MAG TPA: competence/damage-inducible protein A [Desulfotomaculum sp.]|nr:MAG: Putative competence-damage inducible protein [Desulfotomaculum sp. 46_80]KUK84833.1 MAG: Putative competence-damage inducible protein [Desulfofundulus kuznetsovii]HAG10482.1 competence/damage-inducible protein A [Desulfotomaculum sp.]HBY03413.1 competence/damage-inducible protein A [Desulfotomaculum sp.]
MQAELIFTGTELLRGEILNTHAQYLGQRLAALGIDASLHTTVGDHWDRLADSLARAVSRSDLVIVTGGLGSTTDDLTKETAAGVLGLPMVQDQATLSWLKNLYRNRSLKLPEVMDKQSYFPSGSRILPNPRGSAPGVLIEKDKRYIFLLPGPPGELKAMFKEFVEPFLAALDVQGMLVRSKIIKVTGIAEAMVQEKLADLGGQGNPGLAYLAKPGEVHVRVTARSESPQAAEEMISVLAERVKERMAGFIFSEDEEIIEETVGALLLGKGLSVSTAESCTGGLIAERLTTIPGSSGYFLGSIVAYDNMVKEKLLGVPGKTLEQHGAVSRETAVAMALGARDLTGSSLAVGVTGIAGPGGGTQEKPVGLVFIALAVDCGAACHQFRFPGNRTSVRWGASNAALNLIKLHLGG